MIKNKNNGAGMRGRVGRFGFFTLLAMTALLVSACAGNAPKSDPVLERAKLRWDSILSGDLDSAYGLYSPGYRSTHSRVDFEIALRMQRVKWTSAEYHSQECIEDRCIISFKVGFLVNRPVPGLDVFEGSSIVKDTWVRTRGEWWFVPPKK